MSYFSTRLTDLSFSRLLILLVVILYILPGLAFAHADYERSEPGADETLTEAPAEVHVWFSQELFRREEANLLEVFNPDGDQVDEGDSRIDDDDRTHMIVSLQANLPDGQYTVRWRNLSAEDGDEHSGEFSFSVDANAVQPPSQASPAVSKQAVADTPMPAPGPTPPAQVSQPGVGLPCLGGLILGTVLLAGVISPRQRRGSS